MAIIERSLFSEAILNKYKDYNDPEHRSLFISLMFFLYLAQVNEDVMLFIRHFEISSTKKSHTRQQQIIVFIVIHILFKNFCSVTKKDRS